MGTQDLGQQAGAARALHPQPAPRDPRLLVPGRQEARVHPATKGTTSSTHSSRSPDPSTAPTSAPALRLWAATRPSAVHWASPLGRTTATWPPPPPPHTLGLDVSGKPWREWPRASLGLSRHPRAAARPPPPTWVVATSSCKPPPRPPTPGRTPTARCSLLTVHPPKPCAGHSRWPRALRESRQGVVREERQWPSDKEGRAAPGLAGRKAGSRWRRRLCPQVRERQ